MLALTVSQYILSDEEVQEGVPALTVNQPEEGLQVLKKQSEDLKVMLSF